MFCPLYFQDLDKERLEAETELSILRQSSDEKLQIEVQRKVVFDMKAMGIYMHMQNFVIDGNMVKMKEGRNWWFLEIPSTGLKK